MRNLAIVDIVGVKGGINYYDNLLGLEISKLNVKVSVYSSFTAKTDNIKYYDFFKTDNKCKIIKAFNLYSSIKKTISSLKKTKTKNVIFHVFSFNFITYYIIHKLYNKFNLILILHDITSLQGMDLLFIRKKIVTKYANKIVVHNNFSKNELSKVINIDQKKINIIPHGNYIDIVSPNISKSEARKKLCLDNSKKYLLFFGQIKESKGLEILLESIELLDDNVNLIVAGKPWKTKYDKYKSFVKSHNLNSRVIEKLHFINNEERDLFFKACDVCIIPYKKIYQSGVLLMAMSYGLPVIASDLEPNKEIIIDNNNGLLFKSESSSDLVKKINILLNDKNLHTLISKNSFKTMDKYSWKDIANKYNDLLI